MQGWRSTRIRRRAPCADAMLGPFAKSDPLGRTFELLECRALLSGVPAGSEMNVSAVATADQRFPAVAADALGNFVVVWNRFDQGSGGSQILLQRFSADGQRQGEELAANLLPAGSATSPSVAMDADGKFLVAWTDAETLGVFARRYNAAGQALGDPFRVDTQSAGYDDFARVAITPGGGFVVCWMSDGVDGDSTGVFARRYDAAGIALGDEFQVNTYTDHYQAYPSIASDATGEFIIAWESYAQDGSGAGVYAQRYDAAGAATGGEFRVNTTTAEDQFAPSVAMGGGGDFIVTWTNFDPFAPTGGVSVRAQRYNAGGAPAGNEFQVSASPEHDAAYPSVTQLASGGFVVVWQSDQQDGSGAGVFARQYDAQGLAIDGEIQINSFNAGDQSAPRLAANAAGDFVVTWESAAQTGATWQIHAQRFIQTTAPVPTVSLESDVSGLEGNAGQASLVFTAALAFASDRPVSVLFATANGTATLADGDYQATSGTLTFAPGEVTKQITVMVNGDTRFEEDESFFLTLSGPTNATLGAAVASGLIENDDPESSAVVGRWLFYNQSAFDGGSAASNSADDAAIAPDKSAYLPTGGLAAFASVSSYSRGINGIMIDLLGNGDHAAISAADFTFRAGNNNVPSAWQTVPATATVSVRAGGGVSASDRVTITWASGSIRNTWLQVQVLANAHTGLLASDVFYWGNKVGDVGAGSPPASFLTSAADKSTALGSLAAVSLINNTRDFNRDGHVTAADASIVLGNLGAIARLQLGAAGSAAPQAATTLAAPMAPAPVAQTQPIAFGEAPTLAPRGEPMPTVESLADFSARENSRLPSGSVGDELETPLDEALLDALAAAICSPKRRLPIGPLST